MNNEINSFDIKKFSSVKIGGLVLPICISIDKINDKMLSFEKYNVDKAIISSNEKGEIIIVKDETNNYFYGKFKKEIIMHDNIEFIYQFIDNKSLEIAGQDNLIIPMKELYNYARYSHDDIMSDISIAINEIFFHINTIKSQFSKYVTKLLDFNRDFAPVPKIEDSNYNIPESFHESMSYPEGMVYIKAGIEHNGMTYFKENIGKAYDDFSWREKELILLYGTMKNRIDNYIESVKGYVSYKAMKK